MSKISQFWIGGDYPSTDNFGATHLGNRVAKELGTGKRPILGSRITTAEKVLSKLLAIAQQAPPINKQRPYQEEGSAVSVELKTANRKTPS